MGANSSIEWTEHTWNPVRGCSPVSPGCKNCYAERQAGRFCGEGKPFHGFVQIGKNGADGRRWTGKVELLPDMLDIPLRRRKPTTYFVNSMSDLFHENLPLEDIDRVFAVMALCPQHTFQVLTKRAARMGNYICAAGCSLRNEAVAAEARKYSDAQHPPGGRFVLPSERIFEARRVARGEPWKIHAWPLPNVWLGVSVEDQQRAEERIPELLQTPAAVRFLSIEPLLGPVDLHDADAIGLGAYGESYIGLIDWVIVGGESGQDARPCNTEWIRSIKDQCRAARVPVFVKQLGSHVIQGGERRKKADKKGGDMDEWEHDLRVREMPEVAHA